MKPKDAVNWAINLSDKLPSEYRVAAFQEFLRFQLTEHGTEPSFSKPKVPRQVGLPNSANRPFDWVAKVLTDLPPDHLIREAGSEEQKVAWAVVCLARDGQTAFNKSIGEYIRLNLSIAPPNRQNINRALRKLVPKYLSREKLKDRKGLAYLPKPSIAELFSNLKTK